jgi:hypothetical protein
MKMAVVGGGAYWLCFIVTSYYCSACNHSFVPKAPFSHPAASGVTILALDEPNEMEHAPHEIGEEQDGHEGAVVVECSYRYAQRVGGGRGGGGGGASQIKKHPKTQSAREVQREKGRERNIFGFS